MSWLDGVALKLTANWTSSFLSSIRESSLTLFSCCIIKARNLTLIYYERKLIRPSYFCVLSTGD